MLRKTTLIFLLFTILLALACKTATTPQPAECDIGYLPCEDNITECCEVVCDEWFAPCGSDSTDCCFNCPQQFLPCENDTITCCEVICESGYHYCGNLMTDCCVDSTSHTFFYTIDTLGNYGSELHDVAYVNEDNIWVVGNIETDSGEYNAAHWNGSEWEFIGIYSNTLDLHSIYYFNENDIWVTSTCFPYHWDGVSWTQYHLNNMGLDVCTGYASWGTASTNMYFAGLDGAIVHYNGTNFTQMNSLPGQGGTSLDIKYINGTPDGSYVFASGWEWDGNSIGMMYHNNQWQELFSDISYYPENNYGEVMNMAVFGDTAYFSTVAGIVKYSYLDGEKILLSSSITQTDDEPFWDIHVNALNDIMLVGLRCYTSHFNGYNWVTDFQFFPQNWWVMAGSAYLANQLIIVGRIGWLEHGFVLRGNREN